MTKEEVINKLKEFRSINSESKVTPIQPNELQELYENYTKFIKSEVFKFISSNEVILEMKKTDDYINNMFGILNFNPRESDNDTPIDPNIKGDDTLGSWLKSFLGT